MIPRIRSKTTSSTLVSAPRLVADTFTEPEENDTLLSMTVSEITTQIKYNLEESFSNISVTGEISNFSPAASGHWYFTLKDPKAAISCVIFRNANSRVTFTPTDGMKIRVTGNISVYAPRGSYQIICTSLEKQGEGDILAMLEERKQRLAKEGLFLEEHKQKLPLLPKRVGVVTSPTGAAIRDILQVLQRRNAGLDVVVLPAVVQGTDAAAQVSARIRQANRLALVDVLIVGRGGGSLEDLLPFSEEEVVRAIYHSRIPVISAVGHEVDTMLSDYAADLRAPTPSAAAELVSANREEIVQHIANIKHGMNAYIQNRVDRIKLMLSRYNVSYFRQSLENCMRMKQLRLDEAEFTIRNSMEERIRILKERLAITKNTLEATSPKEVLRRGYAMVTHTENGAIITDPTQVDVQSVVDIEFETGRLRARVEE